MSDEWINDAVETQAPERKVGGLRPTTDAASLQNNPFAQTLQSMGRKGINELKKQHLRLDRVHGGDTSLVQRLEKEVNQNSPDYLNSFNNSTKELTEHDIGDLPTHIKEQVDAERQRVNELNAATAPSNEPQSSPSSGSDRLKELKSKPQEELTKEDLDEIRSLESNDPTKGGGGGFALNFPKFGVGNPLKAFGKKDGKVSQKDLDKMRPISNEVLANTAMANDLVNRIEKAALLNDYATQRVNDRFKELGLDPDQFMEQRAQYQNKQEMYERELEAYNKSTDPELERPRPPAPSPELQKAMGDTKLTDAMKTMQATQKSLAGELDPANFSPLQDAIDKGTISNKSVKKVESAVGSAASSLEGSSSTPSLLNDNSEGYLSKLKDFMENFSFSFKLPNFNLGLGGKSHAPS